MTEAWDQSKIDRLYKTVGGRVRSARTEAKITQTDLADAVGVTRSTVANFEAGRQRIPFHLFLMFGLTLKIPVSSLIKDSDLSELGESISPKTQKLIEGADKSSKDFILSSLANIGIEGGK